LERAKFLKSQYNLAFETQTSKLPLELKGRWIRFREKIDFKKANCNVIIGIKETGKSALNENLATHYAEASPNGKIVDMFGSRDNEALGWCRSPYKDKVLFVTGDSVDVSSSWDAIHLNDLKLNDFNKYKVVVSVSAFYGSLREEHQAVKQLMELLWKRTHWTDVWYMLIRETANLIYSRLSIGEDQTRAKAYVIYVMREARHMGYAVGADAIRYMSIDIDLRNLADYTFLKACGQHGLPDAIRWLYRYYDPYSIMRMPINRFILISRTGTLGRGTFKCPPWHKNEKEDLLKQLNIQIDYGQPIDYGDKGFKRISDFEHKDIVQHRLQGMAMNKIAETMKRSNRTIEVHIKKHNLDVEKLGYCERCKRLKSEVATRKLP